MNTNPSYVAALESLIRNDLLPTRDAYYSLINREAPRIEWFIPNKTLPALLDRNFGVSVATSNVRKPRKN